MIATYHNHSTFSDGRASVDAVVARAVDLGVDEVGFSDHLTLHPGGTPPKWSMQPDDLARYAHAVGDAHTLNRGAIQVRLGIELDWFEGQEAVLADVIQKHDFDYIIGSVHFVGDFPVDGNPHRWTKLSQDDVDELHRGYWVQVRKMAESGLFDIAAHLDLPKKFGYLPREQPWPEINAALDALGAHDVCVELNTAGWQKPCADAYPSVDVLQGCCERGIVTTLSADAHDPDDLIRDFDRGAKRLRQVGFDVIARFANRERWLDPLP